MLFTIMHIHDTEDIHVFHIIALLNFFLCIYLFKLDISDGLKFKDF